MLEKIIIIGKMAEKLNTLSPIPWPEKSLPDFLKREYYRLHVKNTFYHYLAEYAILLGMEKEEKDVHFKAKTAKTGIEYLTIAVITNGNERYVLTTIVNRLEINVKELINLYKLAK